MFGVMRPHPGPKKILKISEFVKVREFNEPHINLEVLKQGVETRRERQ